MKKIFLLRSRNLNIKCNFPSQYEDRNCIASGCDGEDSQAHLYVCEFIVTQNNTLIQHKLKYQDIFSNNTALQMAVMKVMMQRYKTRLELLSPQPPNRGDPVDRCIKGTKSYVTHDTQES